MNLINSYEGECTMDFKGFKSKLLGQLKDCFKRVETNTFQKNKNKKEKGGN